MIPDIIVHERSADGNSYGNNNNKIAIEIKTRGERNSDAIDYAKLSYLTCESAEYNFELGLHLDFNRTNYACTYFKNGKKTSKEDLLRENP